MTTFEARSKTGIRFIMLIYFFSGFCSLVDEVIWVRLLKQTLGNTVYASSIVVSMFMGGLRVYAVLEAIAALSALSLPFVLKAADPFYRWLYVNLQPSPVSLLFIQVLISALIVLMPAMIMGSTLPLLGRYVTAREEEVGGLVGRLYFLNTLGATAGCFAAGFVLIRALGVMGSLYLAAGLNLLVATGAWMLSRSHEIMDESETPSRYPAHPAREARVARTPSRYSYHALLVAAFMSGLISVGYELIWMRSIVFRLGGFTYVFSAVLTVYLLGNVIGAWIGSRLSRRLRNPSLGFGLTVATLGLLGILHVPWMGIWNPELWTEVLSWIGVTDMTHMPMQITIRILLYCTFLFLVPAIMMGLGFPLALQAWGGFRHKVGRTTGIVYGANTIGGVFGGVLAGFLLIPLLGAQLAIVTLGISGLWMGGLLVQLSLSEESSGGRRLAVGLPVILATVLAVLLPQSLYESRILAMGDARTVAVKEGIAATVTVNKSKNGKLELTSDGVHLAGDDDHRIAQKTLGHLGALLNKNAETVLSIGFGSGETTACLARHDLERIDCVEIAPELVDMALEHFQHINLGDRLHQEVNMTYMDGKNYLHLHPDPYDIIINGANIPAYSGSAPMFTREHFQNVRNRLNPKGLFITKLHITDISRASFDSVLGTFMEVFPHTTIWFQMRRPHIFFYLAGSNEQQLFSPRHIENELSKEEISRSVAHINYTNSHDVLSCYVGDEGDIERYLGEYRSNSDDDPFIEFELGRNIGSPMVFFHEFMGEVRSDSLVEHVDWTGFTATEKKEWLEEYGLSYELSTHVLKAHMEGDPLVVMRATAQGLALAPDHPVLLEQEETLLTRVKDAFSIPPAFPEIQRLGDRIMREHPTYGSAWLIHSWLRFHRNDLAGAMNAADKAVAYSPQNATAHHNLGEMFLRLRSFERAIRHFREAVRRSPENERFLAGLAAAFVASGNNGAAVSNFERLLGLNSENAWAHYMLGRIFYQTGDTPGAIQKYRDALQADPDYKSAQQALEREVGKLHGQSTH
jgi:spermidine synthase